MWRLATGNLRRDPILAPRLPSEIDYLSITVLPVTVEKEGEAPHRQYFMTTRRQKNECDYRVPAGKKYAGWLVPAAITGLYYSPSRGNKRASLLSDSTWGQI